jgi:hypothetical protein
MRRAAQRPLAGRSDRQLRMPRKRPRARALGGEQRARGARIERPPQQEALAEIASELGEQCALVGALDALGDGRQPEVAPEADDPGQQAVRVALVASRQVEERLGDLEDVDRQVGWSRRSRKRAARASRR